MIYSKIAKIVLCLVLICVVSPSLFTSSLAQQSKLYGGNLRIAYGRDPISFNGILNFWSTTANLNANLFNRLLTYDKQYNLVGDLAEKWEVTPDGKTWTFHLRNNVKWHDGVPFISADVKFHYLLVMNNTSVITPYLKAGGLNSIETPDDYTVVFKFDRLVQAVLTFANSNADAFILPKHVFEGTDFKNNPANLTPIGTGPFKFSEYVKDDHIIMLANPDYFMGKPYLDKLTWIIIPQVQTAELALQNNQVDTIQESLGILFADIAAWQKLPGITVDAFQYHTTWRLAFNFRPNAQAAFPWLKDVRVRQAISYSIDKASIVKTVLYGATAPLDNAVSDVVAWAYDPNVVKYPYNPDKANQLLDDAGYKRGPDGWRFHAPLPAYRSAEPFAEIFRQMFAKVGIDANVQLIDDTTFFSKYEGSADGMGDDVPFVIQTMGTGPDPSIITQWLHSRPTGGKNSGFYNNADVDRLLDEAGSSTDQTLRKQDFFKVQEIVANEAAFVFLWNNWRIEVWKNEFDGFRDTQRPLSWYGSYRGVWWTKGQALTTTSIVSPTTPASVSTGFDTTTMTILIVLIIVAGAGLYLSRRRKK